MFSSVTLSSGPYQRNDNFIVSSVLRKVLSAHVIFACIHVYDIAPCTFLCFFFLTISCLYTSVNIHLSFFLFCIIFCICFVYYSQFTPVFPQVLLFLLLYTSGYSPADFPCFIFLRRVPRVLSSGRTFYRNPPEFRLLSCTVFHPAPRNSVPVFSRSYVYICKVHVPGSGKIDCNLFHWDLY